MEQRDDLCAVGRDILDVELWLSGQKGYGFLSVDRKRRLMHAAMARVGTIATSTMPLSAAPAWGATPVEKSVTY